MKKVDVTIIGAGAGGMTSALYASRANLSTIMLDKGIYGGQMNNTSNIEDYPGYPKIFGAKLASAMYKGSIQFGAKYKYGSVRDVQYKPTESNYNFVVTTDMGSYRSKVLIIATGTTYRKLNVVGEHQYMGSGVSYCAVCDGNFFKNKPVAVVGGGDSAFTESIYLSHIVSDVTILIRKNQAQAQQILQDKVNHIKNIHVKYNTKVIGINGDGGSVTNVNTINSQTNLKDKLNVKGIFIYIGSTPNTKHLKKLGITNLNGWIKTDDEMKTRIPGLFAVGDVRDKNLRQIATAVGDGGIAGQNAYNYIENL